MGSKDKMAQQITTSTCPGNKSTSFLLVNLENWIWAEFSIFFGPSHTIKKKRGRKWKFQADIYILPLVALQII